VCACVVVVGWGGNNLVLPRPATVKRNSLCGGRPNIYLINSRYPKYVLINSRSRKTVYRRDPPDLPPWAATGPGRQRPGASSDPLTSVDNLYTFCTDRERCKWARLQHGQHLDHGGQRAVLLAQALQRVGVDLRKWGYVPRHR
jgi:hypothetical protein